MLSQARIEANRANWAKHRGVSVEGRERIRQACLRDRPSEHSTGPQTAGGKRTVRANAVRAGTHCVTVEPYASVNRFREAIRKFATAIAARIMETGDPFPLLGPEADALSAAHRRLCDVFGVPAVEPTNSLNSAVDLLSTLADDHRHKSFPLAHAFAYGFIDICQAMRTIWNAQHRLCIRLEAEANAGAGTGSLLS